MPETRRGDSLIWTPLFLCEGNEHTKKTVLRRVSEFTGECGDLALLMLDKSGITALQTKAEEALLQEACEHVALKFALEDSDLAEDLLLTDEELAKARELRARGQYKSRLLRTILSKFYALLRCTNGEAARRSGIFCIPVRDELRALREREIDRSYGPLKKEVERIAAGVRSDCYAAAEIRSRLPFDLPELCPALEQTVFAPVGYRFNEANRRIKRDVAMTTLFVGCEAAESNAVLQRALFDDEAFWKEHERFCVVTFLNEVAEQNDPRHAEKILQHIVENLQKDPHMAVVFQNNFPLCFSEYEKVVDALEDQARRFSFGRLAQYRKNPSLLAGVTLCPPMRVAPPEQVKKGREVWERFITRYNYPADGERVSRCLQGEVERFATGETRDDRAMAVILDAAPFRHEAENEDRLLCTAYHPDCFSVENIWKRVYMKAYAVTLLSPDEDMQCACLQRIFFDLVQALEQREGICTAHQLNTSARDGRYDALKKTLRPYDAEIDDARRQDYIIALLDRDTAFREEAVRFPVLEQLGDAIYGLAAAELLFYRPEHEVKKIAELLERCTDARAQVCVSKKLGFDKLYWQVGIPAKYPEEDTLIVAGDILGLRESMAQREEPEKYLADSLEMILGAYCLDKGAAAALDLAKRLLRAAFPDDFRPEAEVRPTEEKRQDTNIEPDYWARILPAPRSTMNAAQAALWRALDKVILTVALGTDTRYKRASITNNLGNTAVYGEQCGNDVSWVFYDYLTGGLSAVLDKYGDRVRGYYADPKTPSK